MKKVLKFFGMLLLLLAVLVGALFLSGKNAEEVARTIIDPVMALVFGPTDTPRVLTPTPEPDRSIPGGYYAFSHVANITEVLPGEIDPEWSFLVIREDKKSGYLCLFGEVFSVFQGTATVDGQSKKGLFLEGETTEEIYYTRDGNQLLVNVKGAVIQLVRQDAPAPDYDETLAEMESRSFRGCYLLEKIIVGGSEIAAADPQMEYFLFYGDGLGVHVLENEATEFFWRANGRHQGEVFLEGYTYALRRDGGMLTLTDEKGSMLVCASGERPAREVVPSDGSLNRYYLYSLEGQDVLPPVGVAASDIQNYYIEFGKTEKGLLCMDKRVPFDFDGASITDASGAVYACDRDESQVILDVDGQIFIFRKGGASGQKVLRLE